MHLPLCSEGMWLIIWERDGISRLTSTGYYIHIPFGTVLFLCSDIVHSSIFGSPGNLCLHCAFQPISNTGDKTKFLRLDPKGPSSLTIRDLKKVVYARCRYLQEEDLFLPISADHNVHYFKNHYYLKDYFHYVEYRCEDASSYSNLLPFSPEKSSKRRVISSSSATTPLASRKDPSKTSSVTQNKSLKHTDSSSSSVIPLHLRKDPPRDSTLSSSATTSCSCKRKSSTTSGTVPPARKKKTISQCNNAGLTVAVKIEGLLTIVNRRQKTKTLDQLESTLLRGQNTVQSCLIPQMIMIRKSMKTQVKHMMERKLLVHMNQVENTHQ